MIKMTLDTKEFDKAFEKYMTFQKRLPADIINGKLMYVARNATMLTKAASKPEIQTKLEGPSRDYENVPLGALIVNKMLGAQGKKGLTGSKMARAIQKLIKTRQNSVNFVRSGWKNAIVQLENYLRARGELTFVRRWQNTAPVNKEAMRRRNYERLGKATVARIERSPRVWGEIQNDISGKHGINARLEHIKLDGLQKAVNKEAASMRLYIERKLNPVHADFNRKQR